ncbi:MAG TPA: hypothetical protein VGN34_26330 [Ktedonobacteraceae bacterium]
MAIGIKRGFFALMGLLILALLSSCGNAATSTSASSAPTSAQPAATTAPASNSSNDYGSASTASTPTANTTTAGNIAVKTASATVDGKSLTILTDAKGMTLYYFTPDTASKTACTAGCAQAWPPLLSSGSSKPATDGSLSGTLAVLSNANGTQVIYNDHPLYTYTGDSAPGQTTGQGLGGKWFVATPDLTKNKP